MTRKKSPMHILHALRQSRDLRRVERRRRKGITPVLPPLAQTTPEQDAALSSPPSFEDAFDLMRALGLLSDTPVHDALLESYGVESVDGRHMAASR